MKKRKRRTPKLFRKPIYSGGEEVGYLLLDNEGYVVEEHYYADDY